MAGLPQICHIPFLFGWPVRPRSSVPFLPCNDTRPSHLQMRCPCPLHFIEDVDSEVCHVERGVWDGHAGGCMPRLSVRGLGCPLTPAAGLRRR